MKTVPAIRRKTIVRDGVNRVLVSIPKGALAQARPSLLGTALSPENAGAGMHSQGTRLCPAPRISSACQSVREQENCRRVDENGRLRAYLAPLFDALPCGVLIADSKNRLQMANAEACRILFGKTARGAAGAAELVNFEADLARVLKVIAESETGLFQLGAAKNSRMLRVARLYLTAEQGLAADRAYLLQPAVEVRRE